ncbi:MAG: extracellular solute-binding protein [Chloroflexota bacterium]
MHPKHRSIPTHLRAANLLLVALLLTSACQRQPAAGALTPTVPNQEPGAPATPLATPAAPGASPTPLPPTGQATVRIWHSLSEAELPALVQVIHSFSAGNPGVLFDVLYIPAGDLRARYEQETLNGTGPTLLLGSAEWGPGLYDAGLIAELGGMAGGDLLGRLNAPALESANYHGILTSLPYAISGVVLYRNKDIMTLNPDTFEDLAALAQASTQGETIGAILELGFLYSGAHLAGLGGQLMDANGYPAFNTPAGQAWLAMLADFQRAGPVNYLNNTDLDAFQAGRVGWIIDGTWNLPALSEVLGPELAIDPWPSYASGRMSGFVMARNVYLSARAEQMDREAGWKFVQHLLSPQAQANLALAGLIPAARDATLSSDPESALIAQAMEALTGGGAYPNSPHTDLYDLYLNIAIQSHLQNGIPAAQALQTAENAILAELSAQEAAPTPAP